MFGISIAEYYREIWKDVKHIVRHHLWLYYDEETKDYLCTLCNEKLGALQRLREKAKQCAVK